MGRVASAVSPLAVTKLSKPGLHFVGHVPGLALHISTTGAKSWILRVMIGEKRRDIGLGPFPSVSLARAKDDAAGKRDQIRNGIDPLIARSEALAALKAEQASFITFEQAATQYIKAHEAGWKNLKHAQQWRSTLKTYAFPVLGSLHVKGVGLEHVLQVLEPLWGTKNETASRLRGRIESILDWAKVRGYRQGENPARWKGNLDSLLARRRKATIKHHAALDWQQCPAFMVELFGMDSDSARILQLCILTACRSGEVRGACWSEFDLNQGVWTIPAGRMKAEKEHRVPLSQSALKLLNSLTKSDPGLVFSNTRGKPYSDMVLTALLRRMGKDFTVHGFRSTFRDWAGESTAFPREVIEHALAHSLKDKAEAAYARGDLFTKRTKLMAAWAEFLTKPVAKGNVTPIRKEA